MFCFVLFCFFFNIFIALLLEAGGWREVTETTTSPLLQSQQYNPDIGPTVIMTVNNILF